jgi:hypothetical protein
VQFLDNECPKHLTAEARHTEMDAPSFLPNDSWLVPYFLLSIEGASFVEKDLTKTMSQISDSSKPVSVSPCFLISYAQAAVRTLRSTAHSFSTRQLWPRQRIQLQPTHSAHRAPPPSSTIANASVFTKNEHDIDRATPPGPDPNPNPHSYYSIYEDFLSERTPRRQKAAICLFS